MSSSIWVAIQKRREPRIILGSSRPLRAISRNALRMFLHSACRPERDHLRSNRPCVCPPPCLWRSVPTLDHRNDVQEHAAHACKLAFGTHEDPKIDQNHEAYEAYEAYLLLLSLLKRVSISEARIANIDTVSIEGNNRG